MNYNPQKIEKKWQKFWEQKKIFRTLEKSKKPKFYCLGMFPYPSAAGIHMGHCRNYTLTDLIAKFKKMNGFNVLHPVGWDAFGLPAENYALKTGIHPVITTKKAIKNMKRQLISLGFGYDWQREISSCKPDYYKWTQWIFLQFYKAGLVYQKEAKVNFCPSCKTVLANEQVISGKCERCDSLIEKKYLKQWFFKITDYVEKLLNDLEKIDWPEKTKIMQKNWIGKSEGITIKFEIRNPKFEIPVFTTRADTLFGCTYMVLAPEHPIIENLKSKIENWTEVEKYIKEAIKKTDIERLAEDKEKTGIECKGIKAINPVNNQEIPVFVANYVLLEYGTGVIMAVPAHDKRDFIFAQKHGLPIIEVIKQAKSENQKVQNVYEEDGILTNSGVFNELNSAKAREEITKWLEKEKKGKKTICYKLRDWLISRQRYWGAPIPLVFCENCAVKIKNQKSKIKNNEFNKGELENPGWIAVPEKSLPVLLPWIKDFKPSGDGKSPLVKSSKFLRAKCPKCQSLAERETDTMDTFVCSSWYYLAYAFWHKLGNQKSKIKNQKLNKENVYIKYKELIKTWLPVDLYIGGVEHAVLHLLYARFFTKALKDLNYFNFSEPFTKLFNQGLIYYQGAKMSKSRGNVIDPDEVLKRYGADTIRLYECFMGPTDQAVEWSDKGIVGCSRFLNKVWKISEKRKTQNVKQQSKIQKIQNLNLEKLIHQTIKKVTEHIENFRFNTAISSLMILNNEFEKQNQVSITNYKLFLKLLAPFAPHISEELWQKLVLAGSDPAERGQTPLGSIFQEKWPKYDEKLIKEETITLIVQINGKIRDKIETEINISKEKAEKIAISREKVKKWIEGKKIKKVIFISGKLINIVV
jgi:leucyl-tRNA synthetase